MQHWRHRVRARSAVSPIEAGWGLAHAATLVATTEDELIVVPAGADVKLTVGGRDSCGRIRDLGLPPGQYHASLRIWGGGAEAVGGDVRLLLVSPSRVCRRFGARYGSLEYPLPVVAGKGTRAGWNSLWKTDEFADLVVDFEQPYKFILWRGMSYAPSWAMDNVMTSLFFAEVVEPGKFRDCCEIMSDRECRYSHARVIHAGDARVVIHWRYALADSAYTICREQWADEVFYVYPDGVAVRNVTVYLDPNDPSAWTESPEDGRRVPCSMIDQGAGKRGINNMELITVNPPGASSEEITPAEALTLMDCTGFEQTYRWPHPPDLRQQPLPPLREYIFRMNYMHRSGVFVASPGAGFKARLQDNTGMRYEEGARIEEDRWVEVPGLPSRFADYIHWPVTRGYGTTPLTDPATYDERPTHTFLGYASSDPVEVRGDGASTWCWLCGIAPDRDEALRERVGAWTAPTHVHGARYDARQGAYVIDDAGDEVTLRVEKSSALVRPTFVLRGWERPQVKVWVDGTPAEDSAVSTERSLEGAQTVVTLRQSPPGGSRLRIT